MYQNFSSGVRTLMAADKQHEDMMRQEHFPPIEVVNKRL